MNDLWRPVGICVVGLLLLTETASAQPDNPCRIRLTDVTSEAGVDFHHTDGGTGERYIVESVVAGLALFDYDNDGFPDIYLLNGAPKERSQASSIPRNRLYRNNRDGTFTDVTDEANVGDPGYGLGVTAADYDNDGDEDLYVNNFGPNVLYRNNGDGTFTDVTRVAGVACGNKVGAGACFLDVENDGDLDLYVANYVDFDYDRHIIRKIGPYQFHPGPRDYPPMRDTLYRNNGDGTFDDVSASSGVGSVAGTGMGAVCLDYDGDRDTDIYVCNDHMANFLFRNDGSGMFEEVGLVAGVAFDRFGNENGSMGADCGDYDNDGRLDLFVTDYSSEMPVLYRNVGDGFFEDATFSAKISSRLYPHVTWGTGFVDFDNDGNRDIFVACGHFMDNIRFVDDRTAVRVRNVVLRNQGDGTFEDVSDQCGDALAPAEASKGAAFDDLDNDGDVDAVVLNANSRPTVIRNDCRTGNHWLQIRLIGTQSNRDGIGARVWVHAGGKTLADEVHSGRSYQSHFGMRLYFGLGPSDRVDRIRVDWPGGDSDTFTDLAADRSIVLQQGRADPVE